MEFDGNYGNADQNNCPHSIVVDQKQITFSMRQRGMKSEYKCIYCSKIFHENPPGGSQVRRGYMMTRD